jgi:hypothetical protein
MHVWISILMGFKNPKVMELRKTLDLAKIDTKTMEKLRNTTGNISPSILEPYYIPLECESYQHPRNLWQIKMFDPSIITLAKCPIPWSTHDNRFFPGHPEKGFQVFNGCLFNLFGHRRDNILQNHRQTLKLEIEPQDIKLSQLKGIMGITGRTTTRPIRENL